MIPSEYKLLIMPGLGDSGPQHWQYFWLQAYANSTKLIQQNWDQPLLDDWLSTMHATIVKINQPIVLVAHSLAVSLVLHYTKKFPSTHIKGALLVAPADVESPFHTPPETHHFAPIPKHKLPFPNMLIASENDPYMDFNTSKKYAELWGSEFISMGKLGHINSASNLEYWPEGQALLAQLITRI
jgi:predicted alpha/beta hydrolase family esterase